MASRRRWLERQEEEIALQERRSDERQHIEYRGVVAYAAPCPEMTLRTPLPQQGSSSAGEEGAHWELMEDRRRRSAAFENVAKEMLQYPENNDELKVGITELQEQLVEEAYGNGGAERHEAQEASAGDRRAIADTDQAGQLDISGEANTARIRTPKPPTDAVRMAHNATHLPFRDWCPICVASRGRSSPHRRVVVNKTADTLPKFQIDYMFIRTVAESKIQPCMTFVETRSGVVISFMCARKGGHEDLTKEILRHFEAYGFRSSFNATKR